MTNNQLTVPEIENSDEAHQLVQQVLDNPRELAPNVQVRFAKRVGRPGASRVMLMDAQTSGPSGEENEDSESKLALRLADGTNVQLSLSFFNENQPALAGVGAGSGGGGRRATYSPFNSYVYEPRTYHVNDRESKLPAIMISMAFLLGAACYGVFYLTGRVAEHDHALSKSAKNAPAVVTAKSAPAKAPVKTATAATPIAKEHEFIPVAPPTAFENWMSKPSSRKASSRTHSSHSSHSASHAARAPRNEGFVPPPPPMAFASAPVTKGFIPPPPPTPYTIPTGIPAAFDPLGALAPAVAHSNHAYSSPKRLEPVSMTTTTLETKPSQQSHNSFAPVQRATPANFTQPIQQIAPSTADKPVVQQYKDGAAVNE